MNRFLWPLLRFCLCAWVGAAGLFVITGVRELATSEFDASTKNQLVVRRFPAYYCCGATLTLVGGASAFVLACRFAVRRRRLLTIAALCAASLVVMAVDYSLIYSPLETMMTRPDRTVDPSFWTFHRLSKYVNMVTVGLVLAAAILAVQQPGDEPGLEGRSK